MSEIRIADRLSQEELLAGLAEEAAELAQAALKLRRILNGKNPTPVPYSQAVEDLNEEIADVFLSIDQIYCVDDDLIESFYKRKEQRWLDRLAGIIKERESNG